MDGNVDTEKLLGALALEQKLSLLAGGSQWRTAAIPELSIPPLKVSDGPSGARGEVFGEGIPAAFLPSGVSLGATWDVDLVREIGHLLAEEASIGDPNTRQLTDVWFHDRSASQNQPLCCWPRPSVYTATRLEEETLKLLGIQSRGVGATPKHFVANDQETKRFKVNVHVDSRTLREVYLLPFQMVVREADPWCMMTAYNKVNGSYCDASKQLLIDIARDEWKWTGVFMSDWGGTTSTVESINNGLDLEMPGPPAKRSYQLLKKPLEDGLVDLKRVNESVLRVLNLLRKANRFDNPIDKPEHCRDMDDPAFNTKELLRCAAASGIVLLKNESNCLPLKPEGLPKLAVLGPNARRVVAGGGGSSYIKAPYWTTVFGSINDHYASRGTQVLYHVGAKVNRYLPTPGSGVAKDPHSRQSGACLEWHSTHDLTGPPVARTHIDDLYFMGFGDVPPEIGRLTGYSLQAYTVLTPQTTGTHKISLAAIGPAKLFLDDELILEQSGEFEAKGPLFFTYGSDERITSRAMVAGRQYHVRIDYHSHDRQLCPELDHLVEPMEDKFQGFRLGFEEFNSSDLPAEAARIAQDCDAAVIVVGRDKEWETESQDIPFLELPGEQVRLIQEVSARCKRVIVVVQAGTPVLLDPWIDRVQAVLYTWYQGQELGNAALDVISGQLNPSGRLPVTFPRRIQDCPAYSSFPGELSETHYSEGLHVGYRWWDLVGTQPHFPIGFGLSFNSFSVKPESISSDILSSDEPLKVQVLVENTGGSDLPGRETVIVWFSQDSPRRLVRPVKQICGFAKSAALGRGNKQKVEIQIDAYAFGMYDPQKGYWIVDAGSCFTMLVGRNCLDATSVWKVRAEKEIFWS
ncbi:hypothetical protein NM208_g792 [Fusarium decemcellulare]|uniref:Uncharacterized protein n=1 Tax=Fusarium decemcellulare TaxID=57161 RepID=A0ACC1SY75_9HYPO|nr:hypothetical protein NM208_g792 [Fusarium decemcellulare]